MRACLLISKHLERLIFVEKADAKGVRPRSEAAAAAAGSGALLNTLLHDIDMQ